MGILENGKWRISEKRKPSLHQTNPEESPCAHEEMQRTAKPELVPVGVQYIYNTVIDELLKNPNRRFSFAETGFLWRWYTSNSDYDRHQLQKLVKTGQIEIIGGGWVQNDEATSHYVDIIDQMTLGLQKLEQIFGECGKPVSGWQIDPFGHSREMANIYAQMGYTSLYFARIHYLEKELRLKNKTLEFNWNASIDLDSQIFTGAFFQDNYGPPEGFCWDSLCGDDPIMDNPSLEEYNVQKKVDDFVSHVRKQAEHQATNQVMLLMGSDFQYTNANSWYINLDKLIKYVNADPTKKVKVIYSTPACYTQAVRAKSPKLAEKHDDFFPYASANHSYWTGYFTSRPTFKGMIRQASSILQLAKQLDVVADLGPEDDSDIEILREASALVQHHDAVTGTAKENVTRDYEKQLARGINEVEVVINDFMKKTNPDALDAKLVICPLLNETVCPPINDISDFSVVIFNSNGKRFNGTVRIPYSEKSATVKDSNKKVLESQFLIAGFDAQGYLSYVTDKVQKKTRSIRQEFFYYEGVDSKDNQPSGAYIFRPKSQQPISLGKKIDIERITGSITNEVRQKVSPWVSQQIRLPKGKNYLEMEWIVGPIPKEATFDGATSFDYSDTEPVAGNYYPITSFGYIKDNVEQFSVITDRAQGMMATNGVVEIMLHRRCFYDDHFGVEEPLDEPGTDGAGLVAMGKHILLFTDVKTSAAELRPLAIDNFHQPILAFSTDKKQEKFEFNRQLEYSGLTRELPQYLHLLSLERWHKKNSLIRFEHVYHNDGKESADFAIQQTFDTTNLFTDFDILSFKQLLLGANKVKGSTKSIIAKSGKFTIRPSEILTFEIEVSRRKP
uniref:Alpha-mannosidase n=1 Tax=Caenorhabditis japonica TaxID=281687 RepID=A0A8R1E1N0_CAEJA